MMTERAVKVHLPHLGTCSIMEWVDNNTDYYLDYTMFVDDYGRILMASEYNPTELDLENDELGLTYWHPCPNGWEREHALPFMWICRKGERYIYITK